MAEHTGQSSQLFPVTTGRNAQFLATIQIGLNVSHTDKDCHETDKIRVLANPLDLQLEPGIIIPQTPQGGERCRLRHCVRSDVERRISVALRAESHSDS